jgi:hypothetical protein
MHGCGRKFYPGGAIEEVSIQRTFGEHSGNLQGTFGEHLGEIRGTLHSCGRKFYPGGSI